VVKKYSELYREARTAFLTQESPQDASFYARNLLSHITQKRQEELLAQGEMYASQEQCDALQQAVSRVLSGEPIAYVLGQWDFYGMTLYVDPNVLIPRDDTCAVTDLAIKYGHSLETPSRILDLCTGSGCIGLAVASKITDAKVTLADISQQALAVAKKNIALQKLSGRVNTFVSDALQAPSKFLGKFDMIVSNPPYITSKEMLDLPRSVKEYEPNLALFGGTDGLDFYRSICTNYAQCLKPGGYLCFEFGMGQGEDVCKILTSNSFTILERSRDYNDRERAVIARYNRKDD
jgi:release factor glutamine methyltransferase